MIEGQVKLELFDALTGKCQERIEDHNMMTNAIDKIVKCILRHPYKGTNVFNPFASHLNLLNSVCLFDNSLTENANNIWLPAGVKPTAYGIISYGNISDSARMIGSYDTTESSLTSTVRKMVWNWAPSQGNGVVSSAALTHYNSGFIGFGGKQDGAENNAGLGNRYKTIVLASICEKPKDIVKARAYRGTYESRRYCGEVGSEYLDMCIDSDNDYKYMYCVTASGLSVIKHKMNFAHFDVFRSMTSWQEYEEETYSATFTGGSYFRGFYNSDEKKLYFWLDGGQDVYNNNNTRTIYVYDIVNKTVGTHGTFKNESSSDIGSDLVVTNGGVYYHRYYNNAKVWKYSFQAGSTVACSGQKDTSDSNNKAPMPVNYILNGIITMPAAKNGLGTIADILIDTSDDSVRYTVCSFLQYLYGRQGTQGYESLEGTIPIIPPYDNTQIAFGTGLHNNNSTYPQIEHSMTLETNENDNRSADLFTMCNYLGTIYNLPESITKTAQQTMKLTYTLTAHEEEGE